MSESLISRNIVISGQRTSFRLEPEMWSALEKICIQEELDIHTLCTWISDFKPRANRTSAIRAFIVTYLTALVDNIAYHIGHDENCYCGQNEGMSQKLCYIFSN
ncbi:ribbon-helix-helix domain-containing protein [Terasakiella sp. A23]|uniref:ribbon-helix-helix domain-containing protein n=1 Tax=Terasakiella sp. FCG-A23 TaxID=3080561 RepID=UPI002953C2E1|nr:ribbon-helix-helix domain-containing protein [Terasakiella sp. A23]MDV7341387.1 ribbon-helix-helix domain-containing protein [Terasakiella sp. A23]